MDSMRSGALRTALRILFGVLLVLAILIFVLWRTENPRLQGVRSAMLDLVRPVLEAVAGPSNAVSELFDDVEGLAALQAENDELRERLELLRSVNEENERLQEEVTRLRFLNNVSQPPNLRYVSGQVIGDAGGPHGQTLLVAVGARDGVEVGAPAMQYDALIGRVVGVGDGVARILLVTDPDSRIPVAVGERRSRAILVGDNSDTPILQYLNDREPVEDGARIVTTGDGRVFPRGLTIGRVFADDEQTARVRLTADLPQVEFVVVWISALAEAPPARGGLVLDPVVDVDVTNWSEEAAAEAEARGQGEAGGQGGGL